MEKERKKKGGREEVGAGVGWGRCQGEGTGWAQHRRGWVFYFFIFFLFFILILKIEGI